jgi:hypothetical protein
MTFKKITIVLFLIFSVLPINKIYAQSSNTGFVPANIWYSKDPFQEGDKIKIYTLIFNTDTRQLSGTVDFFDNTVLLGKKDFTIAANATNAISISWTATAGDHSIFGEIENAKFLESNGSYEAVTLTQNQTEKSSRTVAKKIIPAATDVNSTSQTNGDISSLASNIQNTIVENTPSYVSKPITSATNSLETFRQNTGIASQKKETEVKNDIKTLDNSNAVSKDKNQNTMPSSVLKPFKYVELFFLTISSFIFNNKTAFYIVLIAIAFFILRYIWKKIF